MSQPPLSPDAPHPPQDPGGLDSLRRALQPQRTPRHWWVNQNQTWRQEQQGDYIWSPVRSRGGRRNPYYDFMREVGPGDVVLAYHGGRIQRLGIARSFCYDAPKPTEFGSRGDYWEDWGHRVSVRFTPVPRPFRPRDVIERLRPLLPARYSPLQPESGHGLQNLYLTPLSEPLAQVVLELAGVPQAMLAERRFALLAGLGEYDGAAVTGAIESRIEARIREAADLDATTKTSLIEARVGQGEFRARVLQLEGGCRITGVRDPVHLVASHIKPWRACQDGRERLDGHNGLVLAPHADHLFDRGFLSFRDNGEMLVSPLVGPEILSAFHIDPAQRVGHFRDEQAPYLQYHRLHVLRRAM